MDKTIFGLIYIRFALRYALFLMFCITTMIVKAESYPAECRVTTTLNIRRGPGTNYSKLNILYKNDYIVVNDVTLNGSTKWGSIDYNGQTAYIALKYVSYIKPIKQELAPKSQLSSSQTSFSFSSFLEKAWIIVKYILIGLLILIILAFWREILQIIFFVVIFMGIGALICNYLFDDTSLGVNIGFIVAVIIGLRKLVDIIGIEYSNIFELVYRTVSIPIFYSNRLQHILSEPWRYIFKTSWLSDSAKEYVRPMLYFIRILLYIAITPLRLINAIAYNLLIYVTTEVYDLFFEVLQPSSPQEGAGNILKWLVMFPWRLIKYPICHGAITLTEGFIWTIVDIFIPAITMYHGTDLTAGQAITSSKKRNDYLIKNAKWTQGTFTASQSSWGGIGVYFATRRSVARRYALDPYRLSDRNPVMIVCRVSLGNIINYALAPRHVFDNTGGSGNHAELNKYGMKHGYVTGEWWNGGGGYWEYCMFDWQNRYNHPWRIRPIYVFNFRTGRAQHIKGGMRHWLFDKIVFQDIVKSINENLFLFVVAIVIFIFMLVILWKMDLPERINFGSIHLMEFVDKKPAVIQDNWNTLQEKQSDKQLVNKKNKTSSKSTSVQRSGANQYNYNRHTKSEQKPNSRPKPQPKSLPKQEPSSNGTGFKLERVEKIPEPTTSPQQGTGFRLEKIE